MEVVALKEGGTEFPANAFEKEDDSPSSGLVDECTSGDLVDERDQLAEKMEVVVSDNGKGRHVLELINMAEEGKEQMVTIIHQAVMEQLKSLGVNFEPPATSNHWLSAKRWKTKPRIFKSVKRDRADYGYNKLVEVQVPSVNITLKVPFLIREVCQHLRNHMDAVGIFRVPGSFSRVKNLMERFASSDNNKPFLFTQFNTAHDVATVLSSYLQEMETLLIPHDLFVLFRLCLELPSKDSREEAVLLCTCLIPEFNIHILVYLIEFINEVAQHNLQNEMNLKHLAIVFSLYIMPLKNIDNVKDWEEQKQILEAHVKIIQILFENGHKVAYLPRLVEQKIKADFSHRGSEDVLENDGVGTKMRGLTGFLTRALGFFKNAGSSKSGDALVPQTPANFPQSGSKDENKVSLQKNIV